MEKERHPHYEIRKASIDDIEAIRAMQAQSWRETYQNDEVGVTEEWLAKETADWMTPERLAKSREILGHVFDDDTQFYRIALFNGEVVGLLHLMTNDNNTKHFAALYTAQHVHGTGLAQQLMALADEWLGDSAVDLEVVAYNERAKAFYRKCAFVEAGEADELFRGKIPVIRMVRRGGNDEI